MPKKSSYLLRTANRIIYYSSAALMVSALILGLVFQPVQAHFSPTNTPTSAPDYQLNISDIECVDTQVRIQFVLLNVPNGTTPGNVYFTLKINSGTSSNESVSPNSHTGNVWHYYWYGSTNGYYDVTSAYVWVNGIKVNLHNPDSYNTDQQNCSATATATKSSTSTKTPSPTATLWVWPTHTFTPTMTSTLKPTDTFTPTATSTSLPTNTFTATATSTSLPTNTFTPSPTATSLPTDTFTPSPTATSLPTDTFTPSPTATSLPTDTFTPSPTATSLPTDTFTPIPTTETPVPTTETPVPTTVTDTPPTATPEGKTETPIPTDVTPFIPVTGQSPLVFVDPYCVVTGGALQWTVENPNSSNITVLYWTVDGGAHQPGFSAAPGSTPLTTTTPGTHTITVVFGDSQSISDTSTVQVCPLPVPASNNGLLIPVTGADQTNSLSHGLFFGGIALGGLGLLLSVLRKFLSL